MELLDKVLEYYKVKNPLVVKQLFIKYMNLVLEKNKLFNLTAIENENEFVVKHIADSLSLLKFIEEDNSYQNPVAIDIGSGFGAPGLFVKIAMPRLNIFLNDSNKKKCKFMNEVKECLGISGVTVVCERAEILGRKEEFREKFRFVFARAVDRLNVLCEYALPLLEIGGVFLAQKGFECEDEIDTAKNAIEVLGGEIYSIEKFVLPYSEEKRSIIVIKKLRHTPSNFPRNTKQIVKKPL
ncbi:16S rRNA (guanine(527)-N(7))-methyltransferase RsmG [Anaerocellum diazotrophicum]|uniref:Ribosomal RNA small subunit methyltransferase G n=1 Tax=Caldicellulosiruptor diazotrophicus TaxID=2806205 RepID=A0ABM7NQP4_9FIRM|nr:16S rRNA (guanine(527)-N(7))-methyltransferase RsmG [Caldicellulosiruptor diazotrophicus]BCS82465.1 ribosomal RNA small subunit methyltransferase G [Caldicellulosiruptor diazotrophicus]